MRGRRGGGSSVAVYVAVEDLGVVSGFLGELGGGSDLEMELGEDIGDWSSRIKFFGSSVEELFEHVEKSVILLSVDSGIFDDKTTIFMQSLGHGFTVLVVVTRFLQERLNIDDGYFEGRAEQTSNSGEFEHALF